MEDQWGLTEEGFLRPSYLDLLDAYEVKAKELFGSSINLSVRSPLGIFLRIFAWFSGLLWQLAEDTYNSGFLDTAAGISLSRMGAFIGIRRLAAQKATGAITISGDAGAKIYAGFLAQSGSGQRFVTLEDAIIGQDGTVSVPIQACKAGPEGNVAAGAISAIVTPVAAAIEVTNPGPTIGGRDRETDQEFRERYAKSVDKPGGSNADAIRAGILEVEGVVAASVWENETDETDEDGLPPHSVEAIVYGGPDAGIATAIHARKSAGIQTNGDKSYKLMDASGRMRTIYFSRPTTVPVYLKISDLQINDDYAGDEAVKAALIQYIGTDEGDLTASGLGIGESVYYNRLLCPINAVPGIVDYSLSISSTGSLFGQRNITLTGRQKAVTDGEKIAITLKEEGGGIL